MKGYTKIELINKNTGKVRTIEKHNLITNAYVNILTPNFQMIPNDFYYNEHFSGMGEYKFSRMLPMYEKIFGSIWLLGDVDSDNENIIPNKSLFKNFVGSSCRDIVGLEDENTLYVGYLDVSESEVNANSAKMVYKFPYNACNGVLIQTIALASSYMGGGLNLRPYDGDTTNPVYLGNNSYLRAFGESNFNINDDWGLNDSKLNTTGSLVKVEDENTYYFVKSNGNSLTLNKVVRNGEIGISYAMDGADIDENSRYTIEYSKTKSSPLYTLPNSTKFVMTVDDIIQCPVLNSQSTSFNEGQTIPLKIVRTSIEYYESEAFTALDMPITAPSNINITDIFMNGDDIVIVSDNKILIKPINGSLISIDNPIEDNHAYNVIKFLDTIAVLDAEPVPDSEHSATITWETHARFIWLLGDDNNWYRNAIYIAPQSNRGAYTDYLSLDTIKEVNRWPGIYDAPWVLAKTQYTDTENVSYERNMLMLAPWFATINNLGRSNAFIKTSEEELKITYVIQDY